MDVATVSRRENGPRARGPTADRLLRMIVRARQPDHGGPIEKLTEVRGTPAHPARLGVREAEGAGCTEAA